MANVETIFACLDRNPAFHDAEIRTFRLDRAGPTIEISLNVNNADCASKSEITIRFFDIENLILQDFNHQNVIASLHLTQVMKPPVISEKPKARIRVEVESVFGAVFSFDCESGAVV